MALIKCSECGKEISTNAENCIHCGAIIDKDSKTQAPFVSKDIETEKNITTLNLFSNIVKWGILVIGIIIALSAFAIKEDIGAMYFILGVLLALSSFIISALIKWKALMLKNLYEINKKGGL